jgi:hypothetical protein
MFFVVPLAGTPSQKGEEGEGKGNAPAKNPREKDQGGNIFSGQVGSVGPRERINGSVTDWGMEGEGGNI